jgi:hypothetical protein
VDPLDAEPAHPCTHLPLHRTRSPQTTCRRACARAARLGRLCSTVRVCAAPNAPAVALVSLLAPDSPCSPRLRLCLAEVMFYAIGDECSFSTVCATRALTTPPPVTTPLTRHCSGSLTRPRSPEGGESAAERPKLLLLSACYAWHRSDLPSRLSVQGLGLDKAVEEAKSRMSRYNVTVCCADPPSWLKPRPNHTALTCRVLSFRVCSQPNMLIVPPQESYSLTHMLSTPLILPTFRKHRALHAHTLFFRWKLVLPSRWPTGLKLPSPSRLPHSCCCTWPSRPRRRSRACPARSHGGRLAVGSCIDEVFTLLRSHACPAVPRRYKEGGPTAVTAFEGGVAGFEARAFRGCGIFTSTPVRARCDCRLAGCQTDTSHSFVVLAVRGQRR